MTFHKHISGASWGELVSWLKCLDPPQDSHHHISPQLWRRSLILQPQEMFITVSKVYNFQNKEIVFLLLLGRHILRLTLQFTDVFPNFYFAIFNCVSHVLWVLRSDALWTSCVACWCILIASSNVQFSHCYDAAQPGCILRFLRQVTLVGT